MHQLAEEDIPQSYGLGNTWRDIGISFDDPGLLQNIDITYSVGNHRRKTQNEHNCEQDVVLIPYCAHTQCRKDWQWSG